MRRILWVSRHDPLTSQVEELKRLFGEDCQVVIDRRQFSSADSIIRKFKEVEADDLVLVAPLSVCKAVLDRGIHPLFAEMRRVSREHSECQGDGLREKLSKEDRFYRFVRFQRLKNIKITLEDVKCES